MSYRRRRGPLQLFNRAINRLVSGLGQLVHAACVPFLIATDLWSNLLRNGNRSVRQLVRVNWLRLLLVYIHLPFFEFLRACRWIFGNLAGWWPRASLIHLAQGLPAIMVVAATAMPLVIRGGDNLNLYDRAAQDAYYERDFEKAEVCFRALTEKMPESDRYRFGLAMTADALNEHERAMAIMKSIADTTKQGFPQAHFWLARFAASVAEKEAHLKRAIQGEPNFAAAHADLGTLYLSLNRLAEAEPHLLKGRSPELWLKIAELRVRQGDAKRAREGAENAVEYYRKRAEVNPADVPSRIYWATALGFLNEYQAAADVLSNGMKFSSDPQLARAYGSMLFRWAEVLRAGGSVNAASQQTLLVRAFQNNPTDFLLLRRLIDGLKRQTAGEKDPSEDVVLVRSVLRTLLSQGQSLGLVEMLMAIDADARHQPSSASSYLRRARDLDPKVPLLLGQLAVAFAEMPPKPQPAEGFQLLELGLHAWPQDPEVLYARGCLYLRDRKWVEALMDLEAALSKKSNRADVHRKMAIAYENLGMQDKAESHLERATAAR